MHTDLACTGSQDLGFIKFSSHANIFIIATEQHRYFNPPFHNPVYGAGMGPAFELGEKLANCKFLYDQQANRKCYV